MEDKDKDEEAILSQKFSQLSTETENEAVSSNTNKRPYDSNSPIATTSIKKIKISQDSNGEDNDNMEQEPIPGYLLTTNQLFIHMAQKLMTSSTTTFNINDIQEIALLMYRIAAMEIRRCVTKVYLKSVTGTLKESECTLVEVDRRVWPIQVKSLMLTHQKSAASPTTTTATTTTTENITPNASHAITVEIIDENQQIICEKLLQQQIKDMRQEIELFKKQLTDKKNSLNGFTTQMEESICNYVQQYGIIPLKKKRDLKIALIEYNFDTEILQRQYLQESPNQYQVREINL